MSEFNTLRVLAEDIWARLIEFIPGLLSAMIVLILGWIVSRLIAAAIRRLAQRVNLEDLLDKAGLLGGLRQAGVKEPPDAILGRLVFWIIFLNFLLIALETLGLAAAVDPLRNFIAFLPSVLVGIITLIAGSLLAKFIGQTVQAAMAGMGVEFHETLGSLVRVLVTVLVVIIVIEQMGLDVSLLNSTFVTLLTLAFAGISLAFGLGGRHLARGVLAGFYARESFNPGDRVLIDGFEGTIELIGTLNTELSGETGRLVIPNTRLTEQNVQLIAHSAD